MSEKQVDEHNIVGHFDVNYDHDLKVGIKEIELYV